MTIRFREAVPAKSLREAFEIAAHIYHDGLLLTILHFYNGTIL